MKKKPTKLNDLSQLSSVISFSKIDVIHTKIDNLSVVVDGHIGQFQKHGKTTKFVPNEKVYDGEKPKYITLENVVKDFLRDEQGQKAFDKLNKE